MVFNVIKYILIMGLLSFVGDVVQDVFGGSKSRKESAQYNAQAMAQQQEYAQQNMETQQGYNIQNMMMQQAFNRQNMTYQNQLNIEAFNRENAYNTPLQQRLRSQAAGINQNWQDGAGVVAQQDSGVSSQTPSGGMPSPSVPGVPGVSSSLADPTSLIEGVMHLKAFKNEQDNIKAQTKKIEAEANLAVTQEKAQSLAAGLLKEFGPRQAEAEIQERLNKANESKASANETEVLLKAKEILLGEQANEARANTDYITTQDYINEYNANFRPEMFNAIYGPQGLYAGQAYNQFQQGNYYGVQTQYYPQFMRNQTEQAHAASRQARAAEVKNQIDALNGRHLRKLYDNEALNAAASAGKANMEANHTFLENVEQDIQNTLLQDLMNEGIPIKERRAQINVWEEDAKLKKLEQDFTKAQTDNEKRKIYFNIVDRLIELCPKVNINLNSKF